MTTYISQKKLKEYKKQLINVLQEHEYVVVNGKGSFKQGSCLVLKDKKIVINTYLPVDLQIKFLIEILNEQLIIDKVPDEIRKFIESIN